MGIEILNVSDRLLAAALNGVYQGIIVTGLVAFSLRALGRTTNAATRHAVWLCTLVLLPSLVVTHCFVGSRPLALEPKAATGILPTLKQEISSATLVAVPVAAIIDDSPSDYDQPTGLDRGWLSSPPITPPAEEPDPLVANPNSPNAGPDEGPIPDSPIVVKQLVASDGPDRWFDTLLQRLANPVPLTFAIESSAARVFGIVVLAVCIALASLRILVLLWRLNQVRKLKRDSLPPSATINELFHDLVRRLGVGRKVGLRSSPTPQSFLLGFFRPVILLPNDTQLEAGEAEQILRHELAHVLRRDDWANLIQHFILALLPFHPAAWWISKRLSLEREIACDDHVLQSNAHPRAYALLLAELAARWQRCPPLLAPAASNNKSQLQQRIDMILDTHRNKSPHLAATRLALITSAAAIFALVLTCSAPRILLAQNEPAPSPSESPSNGAPEVAPPDGEALVFGAPSAEIAVASPLPEPPEPVSVAAPARTPEPAANTAGPKFKSRASTAVPPQPAAILVPPIPVQPGAPVAWTAPPSRTVPPAWATPPTPPGPFFASADPSTEPTPSRPPRPPRARGSDSSLEERLDRLEQMVESLMVRLERNQGPYGLKQPGAMDRKEIAKIEAHAKRQAEAFSKQVIEPEEIEKIKEHAQQEVARAAELVRRAAADNEKAAKVDRKRQNVREFKQEHKNQLEMLRKQLEMLQREREKLDRQIEQLEQDQEQSDEEPDEDLSSDAESDVCEKVCDHTQPTQH